MHAWRSGAEARGDQVSESICVYGNPDGPTLRRIYESFRDRIFDDLKQVLPIDVVLLNMHGAMVTEGYDDCQAEFLAGIRSLVGPKAIIGIEMDLHCHATSAVPLFPLNPQSYRFRSHRTS